MISLPAARAGAATMALAAGLALAGVAPAAAAPLSDACPARLAVKQSVVDDTPGWTSMSRQESYPFTRVSLYAGKPGDGARLVPTFENRGATGLRDGWKLPKLAAGYWVACEYGNTTAAVARKLDDDNDFCQANYDPRFTTLVVKHWVCLAWTPSKPSPAARAGSAAIRATGSTHRTPPAQAAQPMPGASQ